MKCDKQKNLERYFDGAMKPAEQEACQKHLETCESCRQALTAIENVDKTGRIIYVHYRIQGRFAYIGAPFKQCGLDYFEDVGMIYAVKFFQCRQLLFV